MNYTILTSKAQAALAAMKRWPDAQRRAIMRGQTRATELVAGRIQRDRLTGKGPFPVSEHKLGYVGISHALNSSPRALSSLSMPHASQRRLYLLSGSSQ